MADVRPFRAYRPRNDLAAMVIAPPYDVLTEDEARAIATERRSFVRVTRPEVDLPAGSDPHSDLAYQVARNNLIELIDNHSMMRDDAPTYYLYRQVMGEHHQVGFLAAASVDEYDHGSIKKHEYTRPEKEDDRTHHMDVLDAQVGLVFLTYRATEKLRTLATRVTEAPPAWKVQTEDGVEHALWAAPIDCVESIRAAFAEVPDLYIADGHHRSAAASRIFNMRNDESSAWFLAGLYPDDQLHVMAYNRVVHDLAGLDEQTFMARVEASFEVTVGSPIPDRRGVITMYLSGTWYRLIARAAVVDMNDPVERLDVSVLQNLVLGPILGIDDPRRSSRIRFVGGIRGHQALADAVDQGDAVAFHLFPTGLDQLFDVADSGKVMPPKSTWFEPKLREGVVVRSLTA